MRISKQDLRLRLYSRTGDSGAETDKAPGDPRPPCAELRPHSARTAVSQVAGTGTIDVDRAKKLIDGLIRPQDEPDKSRRPKSARAFSTRGKSDRDRVILPEIPPPTMAREAVSLAASAPEERLQKPSRRSSAVSAARGPNTVPATADAPTGNFVTGGSQPSSAPSRPSFQVLLDILRSRQQQRPEGSEFVYVMQVAGGGPYDVEPVAFEAVDPLQYMTVSPHGFTIYHDGKPAELIPLERWMQERELYILIRERRFFREFARQKAWRSWREGVSAERMQRAGDRLESRLFQLHDVWRSLLLQTRACCQELADLRAVSTVFPEARTLPDFEDAQKIWRGTVATKSAQLTNRFRAAFLQTCGFLLQKLHGQTKEQRTPMTDFLSAAASARGGAGSSRTAPGWLRGRLIPPEKVAMPHSSLKADGAALEDLGFPKDINFAERLTLRKVCQGFVRFARIADYLVADALMALAHGSLVDMLLCFTANPLMTAPLQPVVHRQEERPDKGHKAATFKVLAQLEEDVEDSTGVALSPSAAELVAVVVAAIEAGCRATAGVEVLIGHPDLQAYETIVDPLGWEKATMDAPLGEVEVEPEIKELRAFFTIADSLWQQVSWKEKLESLQSACEASYAEARQRLQLLDRHISNWRWSSSLDIDAEVHSSYESGNIQSIHVLLNQTEAALAGMQELPTSLHAGGLEIDVAEVRELLLAGPTECLRALHMAVPEGVTARSSGLLEWMSACRGQFVEHAETIDAYVSQVMLLQRVHEELCDRALHVEQVAALCRVIEDHRIQVEATTRRLATIVARDFHDFRHWLAAKECEVIALREKFRAEFDDLVEILKSKLSSLREEVSDKQFLTLRKGEEIFEVGAPAPSQQLMESNMMAEIPGLPSLPEDVQQQLAADVAKKVHRLGELLPRYDETKELTERYAHFEDILLCQETVVPELGSLREDLHQRKELWEMYHRWHMHCMSWLATSLDELDVQTAVEEVASCWDEVRKLHGLLPTNPVLGELQSQVSCMHDALPVLEMLQNTHLKPRHWKEVLEAFHAHAEASAPSTWSAGRLLELNLARRHAEIQEVSTRASQEHFLEATLSDIEAVWAGVRLPVELYRDQRDMHVLGDVSEIRQHLDQCLATVTAVLSMRMAQVHLEATREWQLRLLSMQDTLDEWTSCQQSWKYFESVFAVPDIERQLVSESFAFKKVHTSWQSIMYKASTQPSAIKALSSSGLREKLQQHNKTLDLIRRELADYLATKRSAFPRFNFVSDDELLHILAQSREQANLVKHLQPCFFNLRRLEMPEERLQDNVYLVADVVGEVLFLPRIKVRQNVEETVVVMQAAMVAALQRALLHAHEEAETVRTTGAGLGEWVQESQHLTQARAVAAQITWSREVEDALVACTRGGEAQLGVLQERQLRQRLGSLTEAARLSQLSAQKQRTIDVLVIAETHNRDVLHMLLATADTTRGPRAFEWERQLRYYWDPSAGGDSGDAANCTVRQLDVQFSYGFEFQGSSARLVITPMTDRCWLVITQAMRSRSIFAASGPAGVGKTETVQDLAKGLGVLCIVYQCTSRTAYAPVAQLLSGLVQEGCWLCLDCFSQIRPEVMGVLSQLFRTIRQALLGEADHLTLEGAICILRPSLHLTLTMGAVQSVHATLADTEKMPYGLKEFLRPLVLLEADVYHISEVFLLASGFPEATGLARTMSNFFRLAAMQVSAAWHQSFRTRSSLTVLRGLRRHMRDWLQDKRDPEDLPPSMRWLTSSLLEVCLPQLSRVDAERFRNLLTDTMTARLLVDVVETAGDPEASAVPEHYKRKCGEACKMLKLQATDALLLKVQQLDTAVSSWQGVIVTGPAGAGKSTLLKTLKGVLDKDVEAQEAESAEGADDSDSKAHAEASPSKPRKVQVETLNPKSIASIDFLGKAHPSTGEWIDGFVTACVRKRLVEDNNSDTVSHLQWIVFDGRIDPDWAECLHPALDEGCSLCMPNLQRLRISSSTRFLFETDELTQASPALVARCGIVYSPAQEVEDLMAILKGWLEVLRPVWVDEENWALVLQLVDTWLPPALQLLASGELTSQVVVQPISAIASFARLLRATLSPEPFKDVLVTAAQLQGHKSHSSAAKRQQERGQSLSSLHMDRYLSSCFAFSLAWACGGTLGPDGRAKLSAWCAESIPKLALPGSWSLFDLMLDWNAPPGYFTSWEVSVPHAAHQHHDEIAHSIEGNLGCVSQIFVPTAVTGCYGWLAFTRARHAGHTLLIGSTGTGKSAIATSLWKQPQAIQKWMPISFLFSRSTTAEHVKRVLGDGMQRRAGGILGAPEGKLALIFVDDLCAPLVDRAGSRPPVEVLRQVVDAGGFHDPRHWDWNVVENASLLAASVPAAPRVPWLTARTLRHLQPLVLPEPTKEVMSMIYGAMVSKFFSSSHAGALSFSSEITGWAPFICKATVELFFVVSELFRPTPQSSFYRFSFRNLQQVMQGLALVRPGGGMSSGQDMTRLWAHECTRVFADRLTLPTHSEMFEAALLQVLQAYFPGHAEAWKAAGPVRFSSFMRVGIEAADYELLPDEAKVIKVLYDYQADYASSEAGSRLNLFFVTQVIDHLCHMVRVGRLRPGHLLLIGPPGTGRCSLATLAAHMLGYKHFSCDPGSKASVQSFREFLKVVQRFCGVKATSALLVMTEEDLVNPVFLEELNRLVNVGHTPNIYSADEVAGIKRELRARLQAMQHLETAMMSEDPAQVWRLFLGRVRDQLHLVLAVSPLGTQLRTTLSQFPSLLSCTAVDYMRPLPQEALSSMAVAHLVEMQSETVMEIGDPEAVAQPVVAVYQSALAAAQASASEGIHLAPRCFHDYLQLFHAVVRWKYTELEGKRARYAAGLAQLQESYSLVHQMEEDLQVVGPRVENKSNSTVQLQQKVEKAEARAQAIREKLTKQEEDARSYRSQVDILAAEAHAGVSKVEPEMRAAMRALERLDKKEIQEIRAFQTPPPTVQMIIECVCSVLGHKTDWASAKQVLSDANFLKRIREFDKDSVSERSLARLRSYTRRDDFDSNLVDKQSGSQGAKALCLWCCALASYCDVSQQVSPIRAQLRELEDKLAELNESMRGTQTELDEVQSKIQAVELLSERTHGELHDLSEQRQRAELRLGCAHQLTRVLRHEESNWSDAVDELQSEMATLPGSALLAAAVVALGGPFLLPARMTLLQQWHTHLTEAQHVACKPRGQWQLEEVVAKQGELRLWHQNGLPTDDAAKESALIAMRGLRAPLCIDPQGQAQRWLRQSLAAQGVHVVEASSSQLASVLEMAVAGGSPVLVRDCTEPLPPALLPLLLQHLPELPGTWQDPQEKQRRVGVYLTTSMEKRDFSPSLYARVAVVRFEVSFDGLVERWLSEVIRLEHPETDQQRETLLQRMYQDEVELERLTFECLGLLSESEGQILDQPELIEELRHAKDQAGVISKRLGRDQMDETSLDCYREEYRSVAVRAALLYSSWAAVARACPFYVPSVTLCSRFFTKVIQHHQSTRVQEECASPGLNPKRVTVDGLLASVSSSVYTELAKSLFQKDRLAFAVEFAIQIGLYDGEIHTDQVNWLLQRHSDKGSGVTATATAEEQEENPGIDDEVWAAALKLEAKFPGKFSGLTAHIDERHQVWREYLSSFRPGQQDERQAQHGDVGSEMRVPWLPDSLSEFDRLLLLQSVRPSELPQALMCFAARTVGSLEIAHKQSTMLDAVAASSCTCPVIILSTPGLNLEAEMTVELNAAQRPKSDLQVISMGGEQEAAILANLKRAKRRGSWVLLQNSHLLQEWPSAMMAFMNSLLDASADDGINEGFRIFIDAASDAVPSIPRQLVDVCGRIALEPAIGIRSQFCSIVAGLPRALDEKLDSGDRTCRKILAGLALLHTCFRGSRSLPSTGPVARLDDSTLWDALHFWDGSHEAVKGVFSCHLQEVSYGAWMQQEQQQGVLQVLVDRLVLSLASPGFAQEQPESSRLPAQELLRSGDLPAALGESMCGWLHRFADRLPCTSSAAFFGFHAPTLRPEADQEAMDDALRIVFIGRRHGEASQSSTMSKAATATAMRQAEQMVAEFLEALPVERDAAEADAITTETLRDSSTQSNATTVQALRRFLVRELECFDNLLHAIRGSLTSLQAALLGDVTLTEGLEVVLEALLRGDVPRAWKDHSYESSRPLASWMQDLRLRVQGLHRWASREELPSLFWLGHYFTPTGFLISVLQGASKQLAVPIDDLEFKHIVQTTRAEEVEADKQPAEGVYVAGLFLDMASWNTASMMLEDTVDTTASIAMPVINFIAISTEQQCSMPNTPASPIDYRDNFWQKKHSQVSFGSGSAGMPRWSLRSIGGSNPPSVDASPASGVARRRRRHGTTAASEKLAGLTLQGLPSSAAPAPPARYACPLFRTSARNGGWSSAGQAVSVLCTVHLTTVVDPSVWTLRGVALLCEPAH